MLSKNVKNYSIIFRDGSMIAITEAQYNLYREEVDMKRHNDFIKIEDIETKEILFEGRCNEIVRFKERKVDQNLYGAVYICDFGTRHPISEGGACDCSKEYNCLGITFQDKLRAMGYKVNYPKDITREMKIAFKQNM